MEEKKGKVNAGVVFHTSSTVGVLLASSPQRTSNPRNLKVST